MVLFKGSTQWNRVLLVHAPKSFKISSSYRQCYRFPLPIGQFLGLVVAVFPELSGGCLSACLSSVSVSFVRLEYVARLLDSRIADRLVRPIARTRSLAVPVDAINTPLIRHSVAGIFCCDLKMAAIEKYQL